MSARRVARRTIAAFSIATVLLPGRALAARLPDWAKQLVEAAPAVPEGVPEHRSRILLSDYHDEIQPDGERRSRWRYAAQALSVDTNGLQVGRFGFDGNAVVTSSKAWHVPPGERARKSRSAPVDVAVNDAFLSDNKMRLLPVSNVEKGSIVLFEFEASEKPYTLSRLYPFYEGSEVKLARYELQVPEGWKVAWEWVGSKGPDPVVEGGTWRWDVSDIPAPSPEPLGDQPAERAPLLAVNVMPPPDAQVEEGVFPDWSGFSSWYEGILGDRHAATPEITAAAKTAVRPEGGDVFEILREAGRYVRDKVRYVDVELGIGGMQPRPAAETLSNLYGDCKDKGTLFRSILSAEGQTSYPVLVNVSRRGMVPESVPAWGFDHFIVAVPIPREAEVPPDFAPSVMDAGDLGRLAIVDTTDESGSVGSMSAALAGKRALLVDGAKGRLVTLPGLDPAAHRIERKLTGTLNDTGSFTVERVTRYYGEYARGARGHYASSAADRRKSVERGVLELWPDAILEDYAAVSETEDGAFEERVRYKLRRLPAAGGGSRLGLFPAADDTVPRVSLRRREMPVDYEFPRTIRYEVSYEGLPGNVATPPGSSAEGDGWKVQSSAQKEGTVIKGTFELKLTRTRFDPEAFEDLRALWSALRTAGAQALAIPG